MAETFFVQGSQRAARVQDLFGRIASRYDLINDLQSLGLHRFWKARVLKLARAQPGERALDICCGTGDLAVGLTRHGAKVVGLDFSEPMLGIAQSRVQSPESKVQSPKSVVSSQWSAVSSGAGAAPTTDYGLRTTDYELSNPCFIRADAQHLPFAKNSFDIVTIGYGLRNLADWEAGLREMTRVARHGGRLVVLDFGKPNNALWRGLYFGYLKLFVPMLGRLLCGDAAAYAYILESLKHYPAQNGVSEKMRQMGLASVRIITLFGGAMSINYGEKKSGVSSP
jgi:demethylmenaquinone methyltransferase/2-methoxy-6-polyprenyl-1,4-benzoquinol methylase